MTQTTLYYLYYCCDKRNKRNIQFHWYCYCFTFHGHIILPFFPNSYNTRHLQLFLFARHCIRHAEHHAIPPSSDPYLQKSLFLAHLPTHKRNEHCQWCSLKHPGQTGGSKPSLHSVGTLPLHIWVAFRVICNLFSIDKWSQVVRLKASCGKQLGVAEDIYPFTPNLLNLT